MGQTRLTAICAMVLMGVSMGGNAKEIQRYETLGVVNGSMTARDAGVEISVFLSGQPLFTSANTPESTPLNTLLIEQAQLVSKEGNTLQLQQSFLLSQGLHGQWQLPVQVQVQGKAVMVTAQETSQGVQLTLPPDAQFVTVVPAGAAKLFVPAVYRGDISLVLRITGDTTE